MQYISDPATKLDLVQARIEVAAKGARQMLDFEVDMERATMTREDKLSREVEEFNHR